LAITICTSIGTFGRKFWHDKNKTASCLMPDKLTPDKPT